uniref:Mammalian ependymin-related protein 1 n=1 Tax=Serinus canaria TaxID=9135 RepID=A0A8C9N909_SERCA
WGRRGTPGCRWGAVHGAEEEGQDWAAAGGHQLFVLFDSEDGVFLGAVVEVVGHAGDIPGHGAAHGDAHRLARRALRPRAHPQPQGHRHQGAQHPLPSPPPPCPPPPAAAPRVPAAEERGAALPPGARLQSSRGSRRTDSHGHRGTAFIPVARVTFFEYILLYKDAVMFQIEQVTKLCSKIALTEPWDPYDIPANSTYEDQYYIGGPGDEVMVQEWSDRKPARKLESWVGVYTVKDCYPVQETYTKNYSVTTSTRFFDIHPGIADPSVFTPPSTCQTAQLMRMRDEC